MAAVPASEDDAAESVATQATPSAATKVFAIPELLEKILLHVRPIKLFALQRVDTTFKDVISGRLQERMMLAPQSVPRLRLLQLTTMLCSPQLARATYPLKITSVYTRTEEKELCIAATFLGGTVRTGHHPVSGTRLSPCHLGPRPRGSWENIVIEHPELNIKLEIVWNKDRREAGTTRLGDIMSDLFRQLKSMADRGRVYRER